MRRILLIATFLLGTAASAQGIEFLDKEGKVQSQSVTMTARVYLGLSSEAPVLIADYYDNTKVCEVSDLQLKHLNTSAVELAQYLTKNQREELVRCQYYKIDGELAIYKLIAILPMITNTSL